ncbi:MAG: hypothetical protein JWO93_2311 [Micrococcaceae bacterium]|nr:hypothetical protein [Micrococcaceae bacterium]
MKTEISRELRSAAIARAISHPGDIERALTVGLRRYKWKVFAAYAVVTTVVILLAVVMLLGQLAKVGQYREVKLTAVTIGSVPAVLIAGMQDQLSALGHYSDGSTVPATGVAWVSGDSEVARVDGAGLVTAVKAGTATISATQSGVTGTSTITVTPRIVTVTGLVLEPAEASLQAGDTTRLAARLTYSDGSTAPATAVAWVSGDSEVARVDDTGLVTAVQAGTATISATQSGVTGTATITVTPPDVVVTGLVLEPAAASLQAGETIGLAAWLTYSDGSTAPATGVAWVSGDSKVARVDGTGLVTAVKAGTATISATQPGVTGTSTITVTPEQVIE